MISVVARNNVKVRGSGQRVMVFAHGFGCDQNMWRHVAPAFEDSFQTVTFDHVGAGGSTCWPMSLRSMPPCRAMPTT